MVRADHHDHGRGRVAFFTMAAMSSTASRPPQRGSLVASEAACAWPNGVIRAATHSAHTADGHLTLR